MKPNMKQQAFVTMARPCSVSKEFTPISIHSPDRQIVYGLKTQSQARVQTYMASPYVQSPSYEANKQVLTSPNLPVQPPSPKKLLDSYHYKQKTLDYKPTQTEPMKQDYKPFETAKQLFPSGNDTQKYDFAKTLQERHFDSNKENLNSNTDRRNATFKQEYGIQESKDNIKIGLDFLSRSPIQDLNTQNNYSSNATNFQTNYGVSRQNSSNYGTLTQKSKLQNQINMISATLRELVSSVQKQLGTSQIPDVLNDKMIEILSNFRRLEEIAISEPQSSSQFENEQKIQALTEDYNKLKGILEQLQTKMTSLVQENQKLNKNQIDSEQRILEEQSKIRQAEERATNTQKELSRALECLQLNQKENEDLRIKLSRAETSSSKENMICRQLFQQDEQVKEINKKYQNLQRDYDQLETKYKQLTQEKSFLQSRDMSKSPSLLRSPQSNINQKQNEQMELKLFQLQIENDNLKAEKAHNQVDSRQLDQKNSVIAQLEEKIKSILRERAESEENLQQICYNLENQIDQLRQSLQQKETDYNSLLKSKKELEKDFQSSVQNYQIVQKGLDDKLINAKLEFDKLSNEAKALDSKKNKLQDDLKLCEKQLEQSKLEASGLFADNKKLSEKLCQTQKQIDHQHSQLQQFQQSQQQLLKSLDNYKQQEYQYKQDLDKLENQLRQLKIDSKNQISDLSEALSLQISLTKEKEKKVIELIEEMSGMKDQYEVQKKVWQENINDSERKLKNLRIQLEETIEVKENEINDLKANMEQQIKILDKRNALSNYDFESREQQWQQDLQQKSDMIEQLKNDLEKMRSTSYNMQEEILKVNMQNSQNQALIQSLKTELGQSKQEQAHLMDMLKKRKEEAEQLHLGLEEARKESLQKKNVVEDSRRSMLRQQDLQVALETLQRDNMTLTQKVNSLTNELNRKQREFSEKAEEYSILKRKYDETLQNLDRLEKRWGEKIEQHRKN